MHLSRSKLHRPTVQTAGHTVTKTTHLLFTSSSNQDFHHPEAFFSPNHCVLISPSTTITHLRFPVRPVLPSSVPTIWGSLFQALCRLTHFSPKHVQGLVLTIPKVCLTQISHINPVLGIQYQRENKQTYFSQNDEILNAISEDFLRM